MIENMLYVTIEGIDGCGKTTLAAKLIDTLKQKGYRVGHFSMLPHGRLREAVLWDKDLTPLQRATLYKVAAETTRLQMLKSASDFDIAVVERGVDTFIAYQGFGDRLLSEVSRLGELYPKFPEPDRTYYLDVPVELALIRTEQRGSALDHFEQQGEAFFRRIQEGFRQCILADQDHSEKSGHHARFKHVDGTLSKNAVFTHVLNDVLALLKEKEKTVTS